jgi:tetratricopeptide (TPR) repeat protein
VAGAAALLLVAATALAIRAARSLPFVAIGWGWYLAALLPVLGVVQAGSQALADRYTYLPLVGIGMAGAWGMARLARRDRLRPILALAAVAALLALAGAARRQALLWCDNERLFRRAVAATRENWLAHDNLGVILAQGGKVAEAEYHFREVVRLRPSYAVGESNLATAVAQQGRIAEALPHARRAVALDPSSPVLWFNLGLRLAGAGEIEEAIAALRRVLSLSPGDPQAAAELDRLLGPPGGREGPAGR